MILEARPPPKSPYRKIKENSESPLRPMSTPRSVNRFKAPTTDDDDEEVDR